MSQTVTVEPAVTHTLPNGPAIGTQFARPHPVVAALVVKDEELDWLAVPAEQQGIEDREPLVWCSRTEIGKALVEARPHIGATHPASRNLDSLDTGSSVRQR